MPEILTVLGTGYYLCGGGGGGGKSWGGPGHFFGKESSLTTIHVEDLNKF